MISLKNILSMGAMRILEGFEIHTIPESIEIFLLFCFSHLLKGGGAAEGGGRRKAETEKRNCLSGMIKEFGWAGGLRLGLGLEGFPERAKEVLKKKRSAHCE